MEKLYRIIRKNNTVASALTWGGIILMVLIMLW
jgi:hypothetical protein